jgi:hypothetical protein
MMPGERIGFGPDDRFLFSKGEDGSFLCWKVEHDSILSVAEISHVKQ